MRKLEIILRDRYNECIKSNLYVSWKTFLECAYESASEKKQYQKCADINQLIINDINS